MVKLTNHLEIKSMVVEKFLKFCFARLQKQSLISKPKK
jgi:hypothetical protein